MKLKKIVSLALTVTLAFGLAIGVNQVNTKAYDANGTQALMSADVFGGSFGDVKRDVTMFGDSGCNTYLVNTTVNPVETETAVQGIDFLFLVDTSGSMYQTDGTPDNRSVRVTRGIDAFIDSAVGSNPDKTQSDIRVAINAYDDVYRDIVIPKTGVYTGVPGRTDGYYYDKEYLKKVTATHAPYGGTMLGNGLEGATDFVAKLNDSYYKDGSGNYVPYGDPITKGREANRIKVLVIFTDGDMSHGSILSFAENMRKELARGSQNNYDNIFICNSDVNLTNNTYGSKIIGTSSNPLGDVSNKLITANSIGSRATTLYAGGTVEGPKQDLTSQASFQRNYFEVSLNSNDPYVASSVSTNPGKVGYNHLKDAFAGIASSVASSVTVSEKVSLVEKLSPFFNPYGVASSYVLQGGKKIPIPVTTTTYDKATHSMITDLELGSLTVPVDTSNDKIVVEYKIKANSSLVSGGGINLFSATFFNTEVAPTKTAQPKYQGTDALYVGQYQYPEFENVNGSWEPVQNANTFMVVPDPLKVTISTDKVTLDTYGQEIKLSEAYGLVDSSGNITGIQGGEGQYVVEWKYWDKAANSYVTIPGGIDAKYTVNEKTNFFVQVNCKIGCEFTSAVAVARINSGVTVNHFEEGTTKEVAASETKSVAVGDVYTTKPATVTGYNVVLPLPANASGTATDKDVVVNYYYKAKEVKATVKYLELGTDKELSPELVETRKFGESYDYKPANITGYTYTNVAGTASGTFGEENINITFYYTKNAATEYSLKVKYVDQSGNEILPSVTTKHADGYSYSIDAVEIPGYAYSSFIISDGLLRNTKAIQTGVATGTLTKDITVTLTYNVDPTTTGVIVKYVDENGNDIAPSVTITGNIGEAYTTTPVNVTGYTLKVTPQNATGTIKDTLTVVTYSYEKILEKGTVNVKYVDSETGEELNSLVLTGNVGDTYTTEQKSFEGYKFVAVTGIRIGLFKTTVQEVIYQYAAVKVGEIKIVAVDENGNVISEIKKPAIIDERYTVEPPAIEGYTLVKVPGNATGIFDGNETVTYTYKKNEKTEGKLVVITVDENGKVLYTEEKELPIGYDYEIKPANLTGYTYVGADKELKGRITSETITVTLKYKASSTTVVNNNANNSNNANKLPQTGGVLNLSLILIIGMNLVIAGMFLRKRENENN